MINSFEVRETNKMIEENNLDVRTITMGISLLDCIASEVDKTCDNIYKKILSKAGRLVETGDEIALEFGIPIVNKRFRYTDFPYRCSLLQYHGRFCKNRKNA